MGAGNDSGYTRVVVAELEQSTRSTDFAKIKIGDEGPGGVAQ